MSAPWNVYDHRTLLWVGVPENRTPGTFTVNGAKGRVVGQDIATRSSSPELIAGKLHREK